MVKKIKRIKQVLLVMIMVLGVVATSLNGVNAISNLTWGERLTYPSWLGNWSTRVCYVDGVMGYCLEASKETPPQKQYANTELSNNEALLKVLYYGYGGPADIFKGDVVSSNETKYLFTHIMASYAYCGDLYGGNSWEYLESINVGLKQRYDQIQSMPSPRSDFYLNGQSNPNFTTSYDAASKLQKSEEITFNSNRNVALDIPLPANVTLVNKTQNTSGSGVVSVNGGDTFYLTAPLSVTGEYHSGEIAGKNLQLYAPLVVHTEGNYQDQGVLTMASDPRTLQMNVKWGDVGSLELLKTNDSGALLDGAKFILKHTTMEYEKELEVKGGKIQVNELPVGIYTLTETKVPDGHGQVQYTYEVKIEKDKVASQVVVNKVRPVGTLEITKTLEKEANGATNVASNEMSQVQFKITANMEIRDNVSLAKLYSKGQGITVGSGKGSNSDVVKLVKGKEIGNGIYACDKDGKLVLSGLPMGSYNVQEVACPSGFIKDEQIKNVQFSQNDFTTLTYLGKVGVENKLTKVKIIKKDLRALGLYGATLKVVDENNKVIDRWLSTDKEHEIDGLIPGKTYTLIEEKAPNGFVTSQPVKFTVNLDAATKEVIMVDKQVEVSKQTLGGQELIGAKMQVLDMQKKVVDEWISDGKEHYVSNLEEGKSYILHEDLAPLGFCLTNDIEFKVNNDKKLQKIAMVDNYVAVNKVDEKKNMVSGATLQVVSKKTKNIVDQWVSGAHLFDLTKAMQNDLQEKGSISGKSDDKEYQIVKNKLGTDYLLSLKDHEETKYYRIDLDGNETVHLVQGLQQDSEYILKEIKAPKGYATAKEQEFKVGDKDIQLTMVNELTKILISKQDFKNHHSLAGASLKLIDSKGNVIESWISHEEEHLIEGLSVGEKYQLIEENAPAGYQLATSIDFVVADTGNFQHIVMYDELLPEIVVTGDDSSRLTGFTLLSGLAVMAAGFYSYRKSKEEE